MTDKELHRIPEHELAENWYGFMHDLLIEVQKAYRRAHKDRDLTQAEIAHRLGRDPAFISRCLRGQQNMTVRTMNNIARAMDCRLEVFLKDLHNVRNVSNARPSKTDWKPLVESTATPSTQTSTIATSMAS